MTNPRSSGLPTVADVAFAILTAHREGKSRLTKRSGQFLGQLVADAEMPLSEAQSKWLDHLAERAGLEVAYA